MCASLRPFQNCLQIDSSVNIKVVNILINILRYFGMFLSIFNHKINVKRVTVTLCLIKMERDPSGQDRKSSICHVSLSENPKLLILPQNSTSINNFWIRPNIKIFFFIK